VLKKIKEQKFKRDDKITWQ